MINTDPKHKHTYDDHGNMTCCSLEEKVYKKAHAEGLLKPIPDTHDQHDRASAATESPAWRTYLPAGISFTLLVIGLAIDYFFKPTFFQGYARLAWYALGYLPVGWPVMKEAFNAIRKREVFTEFFLMSIATIGAFCIGEYPEAVAVMLFYAVGELFQSAAVNGAKRSIKALLDIRPDTAFVKRNNQFESVKPETVQIGETIQIKVGEKVPLDGKMLSANSSFNTSALTGESKPKTIEAGEQVLAGMINRDKVVEVEVTRIFSDSSIARILELVQNATSRKAQTELFIRKFAKIYTPIVSSLAVALAFLPYFFCE